MINFDKCGKEMNPFMLRNGWTGLLGKLNRYAPEIYW
jgi:hypothetical protein